MVKKYSKPFVLGFLMLVGGFGGSYDVAAQVCDPRAIPYVETFNAVREPALPPCSDTLDIDGDGYTWKTQDVIFGTDTGANLRFRNNAANVNESWFFTEGMELNKDSVYTFRCLWLAAGRNAAPRLRIYWGTGQHPDSMQASPVLDNNSVLRSSYDTFSVDFTPTQSGVYYFGFHGYGNNALTVGIDINIDDVVVSRKGATLYDLSVVSLNDFRPGGQICTDTNADLAIVVTNTGILPLKNILVDLTYTGAATGARSGTIAAPILMGESDTIVFSSVDLSLAGIYDFTATIYSQWDEVSSNDTLNVSISVAAAPPTADSILITGSGNNNTFNFSAANAQSAVDYVWDFGDGNTGGGENTVHTYAQPGTYTVTLTISNACGTEVLTHTVVVEVDDEDTNVPQVAIQSFRIYPNPVQDWVVIQKEAGVSASNISVCNSVGSVVYQGAFSGSELKINTIGWAEGIYLLQIHTARGAVIQRIQVLR